jgi:cathepsin L
MGSKKYKQLDSIIQGFKSRAVDSVKQEMRSKNYKQLDSNMQGFKSLNCADNQKMYDARIDNIVPQVRHQVLKCKSCWAFAAIAGLECSHIRINDIGNPASVDLSEKQMIACSGAGNCRAGHAHKVLRYLKRTNEHVMNEKDASDDGTNKPCPTVPNSAFIQLLDWGTVDRNGNINAIPSVTSIKEAICKFGPIVASMEATPPFRNYRDGVFFDRQSNYNKPTSNHVVLIVGWNDDLQAWLIRNSWGEGWGMRGYCWIKYNTNNIGRKAVWAIAKKIEPKF